MIKIVSKFIYILILNINLALWIIFFVKIDVVFNLGYVHWVLDHLVDVVGQFGGNISLFLFFLY